MPTIAQMIANQQNSKLSTGPRTPAGKAASSLNHTTHGLCAADPILPSEDRAEFNQLLQAYRSDFEPLTIHQEFLVSQMTGASWKLQRIERMETDMFAALDDPAKAFTDAETSKAFARLERYRASIERTYHRAARELRAARKEQFKPNSRQIADKANEELFEELFGGPTRAELHEIALEVRRKSPIPRDRNHNNSD